MHRTILLALRDAIDGFVQGKVSVAELQARLEANASALNRSFAVLVKEIHDVNADLEEIQFGMIRSRQSDAAISRIERTRRLIAESLLTCHPEAEVVVVPNSPRACVDHSRFLQSNDRTPVPPGAASYGLNRYTVSSPATRRASQQEAYPLSDSTTVGEAPSVPGSESSRPYLKSIH